MQIRPLPDSLSFNLKRKLDMLKTKLKYTPLPETPSFKNLGPKKQKKATDRWTKFRLIEREYLKALYHERIKAKVFDQLFINIACFLGTE